MRYGNNNAVSNLLTLTLLVHVYGTLFLCHKTQYAGDEQIQITELCHE